MPAPQGRTVLEQLEAWVAAQPEPKRTSALRIAGLDNLYSMIQAEGELSKKVRFSLQSPRIQRKLTAVDIDVGTTWVDMAKKAVDPTRDWFPEVKTRQDVVGLLRPYIERIGGDKQLSRMFFDGTELDSFCNKDAKSLPGFENIVAIIRFCTEDARSGGERQTWGSDTLFYMEGQWNVFGRGCERIPELVGDNAFKTWMTKQVPHERVDHIAKKLNGGLGEQVFSATLLIDWRKGQRPSREKFETLLRAIQIAFPEWLSAERTSATVTTTVMPHQGIRTPVQPVEKPNEEPSTIEEILTRGLEGIIAELRARRSSPPAGKTDDPGEVVSGMRFVLTAASFKREAVFSLDEVDDTANLIGELTRRLAQINSMEHNDKRAVLRRLRHAFDEMSIHIRHMDVADEDLPSMFLDMRVTATGLGGGDLDDIKS